jgi:hypothetical protein
MPDNVRKYAEMTFCQVRRIDDVICSQLPRALNL